MATQKETALYRAKVETLEMYRDLRALEEEAQQYDVSECLVRDQD